MDYEKKYKEALEKAKKLYEQGTITESLSYFFPELEESEDEKIRTAIFNHLKKMWYDCEDDICGVHVEDAIAWLEKQDKQKPFDYENAAIQQKDFAPKEEPKFEVGDWVVYNYPHTIYPICLITAINENYVELKDLNGGQFQTEIYDLNTNYHLWTIKDAKDGDVLYHKAENGIEYIVMNKGINKFNHVDSYFRYNSIDGFDIDVPSVLSAKCDSITPATKEQRALLFKKMKEAGYEWNAEKKKLKIIDFSKHLKCNPDTPSIIEQNPA